MGSFTRRAGITAAALTVGIGLTALPASADKAQDKSREKAFNKAVRKTFQMQREARALRKAKAWRGKRITTDTTVTCLNGVGDVGLLNDAWDAAAADLDSIHNIILPSNCTFQLVALTLLPLDGPGNVIVTGGTNTVLLGSDDVRHFQVNVGARLSLYNLTLRSGNAPDGEDGGSILNYGTVTVYNCTLTNNTSPGFGGGIYIYLGSANIYHSTFTSNTAALGGGGISAGEDNGSDTIDSIGEVHISTSTFQGNIATAGNGGGFAATDGLSTVVNSLFQSNLAPGGDGGGTYNGVQSLMNAYGNLWTQNNAVNGGGVASTDGFFGRSIGITNNVATTGGGGYFNIGDLNDAVLTLSGGYVTGNFAGGLGGGINNLANPMAQVTVAGTGVSGNFPNNCVNVTGCSP